MPETHEQFVRRTRTGPDHDRWRVPCGETFPDEITAGDHYLTCDACDEEHRKRKFRAG